MSFCNSNFNSGNYWLSEGGQELINIATAENKDSQTCWIITSPSSYVLENNASAMFILSYG